MRSHRSEVHWLLSTLAVGQHVRLVGALGDGAQPVGLESYRFVVPRISCRVPLPPGKYRVILETQGASVPAVAIQVEGEIAAAMQSGTMSGSSLAATVRLDDGILDMDLGDDMATAPSVSAIEVQGIE